MILIDFLFSFLIALVVSLVFFFIFRRKRLRIGLVLFFIIVFLFTWAGGIWLAPGGPTFRGIYWVPFLLIAVVISFLLATLIQPYYVEPRTSESRDLKESRKSEVFFISGLFFWILLFILGLAIIFHYVL